MYDYSGEWAQTVGLPAKSGVGGCVFVVVPGVCGFSIFSPPLDHNGNSKKAVMFTEMIVEKYKYNIFDVIYNKSHD